MIKQGLVQELTNFHTRYNEQRLKDNVPPDYTKGIFQSIGFKEFHEYLILNEKDRQTEENNKLFETGITNLKLVTRRYARKQIKWIANRFLGRPDRQVPSVYGLDTTEVEKWKENVEKPAFEIIQCFMDNTECKYKPLPVKSVAEATAPCSEEETYFCEICERVFVGLHQFNEHKQSKKHKKVAKRKKIENSVSTENKDVEVNTEDEK